jgi:ATP-binding cassette subfamily B protein
MGEETVNASSGWSNRLGALRDVPKLWHLLWESNPKAVFGTTFLRVLGGLTPVAMLYAAKRVVDLIAQASKGQAPEAGDLWFWIGLEFGLAACSQLIAKGVDYLDSLISDQFSHNLALKIMRHAASLDLSSFEDPTFQDRLNRARVQATDRTNMLTSAGWLVQRLVMLISLAVGIVVYSPWLVIVLIFSVLPAFLVESHFAFLGYTQSHETTPDRRRLDYYLELGSSPVSAKEVKSFALAPYLEKIYAKISSEIIEKRRRLATRRLTWSGLFAVVAVVAYYGAYAYLAREALFQRMSLGTFTFMVGAIAGANGHLQTIFTLFSGIADQALFLRDLILFLEETPHMPVAQAVLSPPVPLQSGLAFEDVTFGYPGSERPVLENLSFQLRKGQRVALVGENGEGKTTLVKLIARLYDPTSGRILLDGRDLKEYKLDELRKHIGIMFQDFVRYDLSARENIAVGDISQLSEDEELNEASRKSNAADLVEGLPEHLDQMLGRRFEGGVDLSGGEWQRIALARAYLRHAEILILDEPTASLDAMAEHEIFQKFAELTQGKLAVFISHRFSTVRMADRILVLSQGKIAEDGTHDQLLQAAGLYARLFEVQAASYR